MGGRAPVSLQGGEKRAGGPLCEEAFPRAATAVKEYRRDPPSRGRYGGQAACSTRRREDTGREPTWRGRFRRRSSSYGGRDEGRGLVRLRRGFGATRGGL